MPLLVLPTRSITSSRLRTACTTSTGAALFWINRLVFRDVTSTTAKLLSWTTIRNPESRDFRLSIRSCTLLDTVDLDFTSSADLAELPAWTHSATTACKNDCRANSFTKTTSGAYALLPPKLKRAATSSFAASVTFPVRSTTARVRQWTGEAIWFAFGHRSLSFWFTCIAKSRKV